MRITTTSFDIRAWRQRLALTQRAAASLLGVSLTGYRQTEYRNQDRGGFPCQKTLALLAERIERDGR